MINKALHTIKVLCEELVLDHVAEAIYFKYTKVSTELANYTKQNTPDTLIKLFFKCKEFFLLRTKALTLLKSISEREGFMQAFQVIVKDLNTSGDSSKDSK
jgi:hypothetical protein